MADTFIFYKSEKKRQKKSPSQEKMLTTVLWIVIFLLLFIALGKILLQFVISPGVQIKNIIIESDLSLKKDDIIRLAGIEKTKYYFNLDIQGIKKRLEAIPVVREAVVEKQFPDTLKIALYRRVPVAMALARNGGGTIPVTFDETGTITEVGKEIEAWDLPVLSGLEFNSYKPGTKLPDQLLSLLKEIKMLKKEYPKIFNLLSEIKIEPVSSFEYELVLYFLSYRTGIRLGNSLGCDKLGYAIMVLDVLDKKNLKTRVDELDFRTNEVVFRGGAED